MRELDAEGLAQRLETRMADDLAGGRVGGAVLCVMQHGKTVYRNCFGVSSPGGEPLREDAMFRMASMTKPITAAAALIQMERGKFSLDDKVSDYLPAFAEMEIGKRVDGKLVRTGKAEDPMRILHLLTHTSGLGSGDTAGLAGSFSPEQRRTLAGTVDGWSGTPLAFEPFSTKAYSGTAAFDVLARIIELTSDRPFDEFLKTELFDPLGMENTTFAPDEAQWKRMIVMHDLKDGKPVAADSPKPGFVFADFPVTETCGGAGLASDLHDYSLFAEMLRRGGQVGNRSLIGAEWIRTMRTNRLPAHIPSSPEAWGLGVRVITSERYGRLPVGSFGWSGAYGTHFFVDPADDVTAVYLKNSLFDGGSGAKTSARFEEDLEASYR